METPPSSFGRSNDPSEPSRDFKTGALYGGIGGASLILVEMVVTFGEDKPDLGFYVILLTLIAAMAVAVGLALWAPRSWSDLARGVAVGSLGATILAGLLGGSCLMLLS